MLQTNKGKGRVSNMNSELKRYLSTTFLITWVCWWVEALLIKLTDNGCKDLLPMIFYSGRHGTAHRSLSCYEQKTIVVWGKKPSLVIKSGVLIFVLFALAEIALSL